MSDKSVTVVGSTRSADGTGRVPQPLRIFRELVSGHPVTLAFAVLTSLVGTAAALAVPLLVRELVNALSTGAPVAGPVLLMALIALSGALFSSLSGYLFARCGELLVLSVRERLVLHLVRIRMPDAQRTGTGNLVARVTSDTAQMRGMVDVAVAQLPAAVIAVTGTVILMALLDPVLLLITLCSFVAAAAVVSVVVVGVRRSVVEQQTAMGELAQRLTGALAGLTVIKAARAERQEAARVVEQARRSTDASIRAARLQSAVTPVLELAQQIALVGVVVTGGARLVSGSLSAGDFSAFLLYLLQLVGPILALGLGFSRIQVALGARGRVEEALSLDEEEPAADDVRAAEQSVRPDVLGLPAVSLRGVTHHYGDERVLSGVDLTVPRLGMTALVGPSGAGKTTVLSLVERFADPQEGTVSVFGTDVRDWPLSELRGRVAYLDQAFTIVPGSVRHNLTLGHPEVLPEPLLWMALNRVGLADRVMSLPDALDTELGRETNLSGGQRQRLAIARLLLSDADVWLLDEPTSQLDSVNEDLLRRLMAEAATTTAVIVVAHRMSTVRDADHIVVLDEGVVTGAGSHDLLMRDNAVYRGLVSGQLLSV